MHVRPFTILGALAGLLLPLSGAETLPLVISEFLANPDSNSLRDEDDDTSDWVEISNPNSCEVDLGGYFLTDDPAKGQIWEIPSPTLLAAGERVVIFASGKNRAASGSQLHTDFRLNSDGDSLLLIGQDGSTTIDSYTWTMAHSGGKSFGLLGDPEEEGFFITTTPGEVNVGPFFIPGRPLFMQNSQTFTGSLEVIITPEISGLDIHYTLDKSEPTAASPKYTAPLNLTSTTVVRARLIDPSDSSVFGDISARNYIELSTAGIGGTFQAGAADLPTFTSDLPIVILENLNEGIPGQANFIFTTFSLFEPAAGGRTELTNEPSVSTRAAYRVRGQSSAGFAKKQYRLELRNQEDEDKAISLLGLPADSDWVLAAPFTDKSLIRNALVFELGRVIGLDAPRTRHVELFLNENGGELNYATDYRGVYLITETNKRSRDRVDIQKVPKSATTEPEIDGGYLMKWEFNASSSLARLPGWSHLELVEPDAQSEATIVQKQWISDYIRAVDNRIDGADFKDPILGYEAVIDVPSYANLFVINELTRDQDAYMRSSYFYKDRGGKITQGPLWDYNLIMGTGCCRNNRNTMPIGGDSGWQYIENNGTNEGQWEIRLVQDPDFWQAFVDRWQFLRTNVLSDAELHARMDAIAGPLTEAAIRNFAKWNNLGTSQVGFPTPVTQTWEQQVDFMKNWASERMLWIDSQMTSPPTIAPGSGVVTPGAMATVNGVEGTIYYTTDGSDPRLEDGLINPDAQNYVSGGLEITQNVPRGANWNYLADGTAQGSSAIVFGAPGYDDSHWTHPDYDDSPTNGWVEDKPAPLGYANPVATIVPFGPQTFLKYPTTYFRTEFEVTGASMITEGNLEVQYDDGVVIYINGREVTRQNMPEGEIGYSTLASSSQSGAEETTWVPVMIDASCFVEGRNVIGLEVHKHRESNGDLSFDFGLTVSRIVGTPPTVDLNETTILNARSLEGSDWSRLISNTFVVGTGAAATNLVISELHYHPANPSVAEIDAGYLDADDFEFLELTNVGDASIDLSGVCFINGITFSFPDQFELASGERTLIAKNSAALNFRYAMAADLNIAGEFKNTTGLANGGERITLVSLDGAVIQDFTYDDLSPWPIAPDGSGPSLVLNHPFTLPDHRVPTNWRVSQAVGGTPSDAEGTFFGGGGSDALSQFATGGIQPSYTELADGRLQFTVGLNLLAEDTNGRLEYSLDLDDWFDATSLFQVTSQTQTGGNATRVLQSAAPITDEKYFLRYRFVNGPFSD